MEGPQKLVRLRQRILPGSLLFDVTLRSVRSKMLGCAILITYHFTMPTDSVCTAFPSQGIGHRGMAKAAKVAKNREPPPPLYRTPLSQCCLLRAVGLLLRYGSVRDRLLGADSGLLSGVPKGGKRQVIKNGYWNAFLHFFDRERDPRPTWWASDTARRTCRVAGRVAEGRLGTAPPVSLVVESQRNKECLGAGTDPVGNRNMSAWCRSIDTDG